MMTKAKELKAGDKVRMPWGDTSAEVMTVADVRDASAHAPWDARIVVTWGDGTSSSFGRLEGVEVMS